MGYSGLMPAGSPFGQTARSSVLLPPGPYHLHYREDASIPVGSGRLEGLGRDGRGRPIVICPPSGVAPIKTVTATGRVVIDPSMRDLVKRGAIRIGASPVDFDGNPGPQMPGTVKRRPHVRVPDLAVAGHHPHPRRSDGSSIPAIRPHQRRPHRPSAIDFAAGPSRSPASRSTSAFNRRSSSDATPRQRRTSSSVHSGLPAPFLAEFCAPQTDSRARTPTSSAPDFKRLSRRTSSAFHSGPRAVYQLKSPLPVRGGTVGSVRVGSAAVRGISSVSSPSRSRRASALYHSHSISCASIGGSST